MNSQIAQLHKSNEHLRTEHSKLNKRINIQVQDYDGINRQLQQALENKHAMDNQMRQLKKNIKQLVAEKDCTQR